MQGQRHRRLRPCGDAAYAARMSAEGLDLTTIDSDALSRLRPETRLRASGAACNRDWQVCFFSRAGIAAIHEPAPELGRLPLNPGIDYSPYRGLDFETLYTAKRTYGRRPK